MPIFPAPYRIAALILLAIACIAYGWMKGAAHGEARLEAFRQSVAVEGAKAQALADATAKRNIERKDAVDASYKTALVTLGRDIDRMRRDAHGSTYVVPATPTVAGSPDRACFDRAKLNDAIRAFAEGTAGLVGEGETIRLRLATAVEWGRR